MSTSAESPLPPALTERLDAYRRQFAAEGPRSLKGTEPVWEEARRHPPAAGDPAAQGAFYELLAYDALCIERPGWAYVCIRASQVGYDEAGRPEDVARVQVAGQTLLEAFFPPYEEDLAVLGDVRRWLWARGADLAEAPGVAEALRRLPDEAPTLPDPVADRAVELKHRWLFRLLRTHQIGRVFRIDRAFARFPLTSDDQVLLRVLAAAHDDRILARALGSGAPHLTVGTVVDLLANRDVERAPWLQRLDGRAPLRRFGLVHLEAPRSLEQPLRDRGIQIGESLLAALQGRDWWPAALEEGIGLHHSEHLGAVSRYGATVDALEALPGPRVHLIASSRAASLAVVGAWSARRASGGVLDVADDRVAEPAWRRAVARQARLRDALVLVGPDARGAGALADLLPHPLVQHHDRGSEWPLGVTHPAPTEEEALLAWNAALSDQGLAEIGPAEVRAHLAPLALDEADIQAVVRLARPHGPQVEATTLAAVARAGR